MSKPPAWLDRGLVMLSNHEPLSFIVRRGRQRLDAAAQFAYEHTEDFVRQAAAFGITCLRTHYYKGGGLEYEAPERQQTAAFVKLCHKHGLRVQAYIQHGTLSYETLFLEEPRAREWLARDQHGHTSGVTYGYQFFRYKPCFNSRGFVTYLKRVVAAALADGVDMLGFDNSAWSVEPAACQCATCRRKFRRFLNRKHNLRTAAGRQAVRERFALPSFACVEPPNWHRWAQPINLFEVDDPMIQEWVDFKCECLRENIAEISDHARRLNPDVVVEWNCYSAFGDNGPYWVGVDTHRNMAHLDAVYNEQDPFAGIDANGTITGMVPAFKLFQGYGKFMLPNCNYHAKSEAELCLSIAENLAFNGGRVGMLPGGFTPDAVDAEKRPLCKRTIDFAAAHCELFRGLSSAAAVAVVESFETLAFDRIGPHQALAAMVQTLLAGNVDFDVLTLDRLEDAAKYRLLVLPNVRLLSDANVARLLDFVRAGGRLLLTEETARFDAGFRRRSSSPLADAAGPLGKGEICHVPHLTYPQRFSYKPEDWYIDPKLWGRPAEHEVVLRHVHELLGPSPLLHVRAPFGCVSTLQSDEKRLVLHLLNYTVAKPLCGITVHLRPFRPVTRVELLSPEEGCAETVPFRRSRGGLAFTVSELVRYRVYVCHLR